MKIIFAVLTLLLMVAGAGILFALTSMRASESPAAIAYVESVGVAEDVEAGADAPDRQPTGRRARHAGPDGEEWLTRFELIERSGELISSDDLKGQPYVVGFFFSMCPSICVNQNAKVKELQDKFADQPLRLLSISCDPEVDRPEVLAEYAERFDADPHQWLFLTGELPYIRRVGAEMYFLPVERRFHAEKFVLVDAHGKNVDFYTWSDPIQFKKLERDIEAILEAGGSFPPKKLN